MPLSGTYVPSPWEPIATQVAQYEATGGVEGGELEGAPCIILTTVGNRSGNLRKTPLIRVEHDGAYAVLASMGGAPQHPAWYHNLADGSPVTVQDGPEVHDLVARQLDGDEKAAWWARATEVWPSYDDYQASTDRQIPLVLQREVYATVAVFTGALYVALLHFQVDSAVAQLASIAAGLLFRFLALRFSWRMPNFNGDQVRGFE